MDVSAIYVICESNTNCVGPRRLGTTQMTGTTKEYSWNLANLTFAPGRYKVLVCSGSGTSAANTTLCDTSDNWFTVAAPTTTQPTLSNLTITNLEGGSTIQAQGGIKIGWRVANAPVGARIVLKIFRNGVLFRDYGLVSGNPFIEAATIPCAPVHSSLLGAGYEVRAYLNDSTGKQLTTASVLFSLAQRNCGETPTTNRPPQFVSGSGPAQVYANQAATFNWNASDPDGDNLAWSVNWGDSTGASGQPCPGPTSNASYSGSHTYAQAGTYTVVVRASDCKGGTAERSQTITVSAPVTVAPSLSGVYVTNLNGGSTIEAGGGIRIGWVVRNATTGSRIVIKLYRNGSLFHDYGLVSGNPFMEAAKTPCATVASTLLGSGYEARVHLQDASGNLVTTASAPFAIAQRNCTAASLSVIQLANIVSALDEIMAALRNL
jgi:hypothetical protein